MPRRKHPATAIITLIFLAVGTFVLFLERDPGVKKLSAAQTADLLARATSVVVIDVRTQEEWDEYHAPNTTLIPLDQLPSRLNEVPRDKEVVVVCRSGNRSQQGRDILLNAGFEQVTSMKGGLKEWRDSGYPIEA